MLLLLLALQQPAQTQDHLPSPRSRLLPRPRISRLASRSSSVRGRSIRRATRFPTFSCNTTTSAMADRWIRRGSLTGAYRGIAKVTVVASVKGTKSVFGHARGAHRTAAGLPDRRVANGHSRAGRHSAHASPAWPISKQGDRRDDAVTFSVEQLQGCDGYLGWTAGRRRAGQGHHHRKGESGRGADGATGAPQQHRKALARAGYRERPHRRRHSLQGLGSRCGRKAGLGRNRTLGHRRKCRCGSDRRCRRVRGGDARDLHRDRGTGAADHRRRGPGAGQGSDAADSRYWAGCR